jgi:dihydroorotate dehydrogenase
VIYSTDAGQIAHNKSLHFAVSFLTVDIYQLALRPLLFQLLKSDPEAVHRRSLELLSSIDLNTFPGSPLLKASWRQLFCSVDNRLQQTIWGNSFPNPVGLAAGFDKDGLATGIWPYLGFGFAELGTVTYHAQPGNPQPRLFRLPADQAALNRMGFNNLGSAVLAERLAARQGQLAGNPIGINLGKSKITEEQDAAADYVGSFQRLQAYGDYFVINVSSPNTPGLRNLQNVELLNPILAQIQQVNQGRKPLLVKIAPDLAWEDIELIVQVAQQNQLAGIIATNTTINRAGLNTKTLAATGRLLADEAGGISGAPVRDRSTAVIRFIYQVSQGQLPIIGVGGIFSAADAWDKITAGASLVQVYTGWTYQGPWLVSRILAGLLTELEKAGLDHIGQAVGLNADVT